MLSAVPYIAASIGMVLIGASSDRTGERFLHLAVPTAIGAVAFIATAFLVSPTLSLAVLAIAAVGNTSTRGPFWALPSRFLTGTAAAGGIALINTLASLGGLVGPYAVGLLKTLTGGFGAGLVFLGVLMLIGAGATLLLRNAPVLAEHEN
jgi:MFS transporter, ACS family, tartrate transporter